MIAAVEFWPVVFFLGFPLAFIGLVAYGCCAIAGQADDAVDREYSAADADNWPWGESWPSECSFCDGPLDHTGWCMACLSVGTKR